MMLQYAQSMPISSYFVKLNTLGYTIQYFLPSISGKTHPVDISEYSQHTRAFKSKDSSSAYRG